MFIYGRPFVVCRRRRDDAAAREFRSDAIPKVLHQMERVFRLDLGPPVQDRNSAQVRPVVDDHDHVGADHDFGADRRQQKSARIVHVFRDMRVHVGHHHVCNPDETFQPGYASNGRRRVSRLREAHARCSQAQDVGNTQVLRRIHDEGDGLVSHAGLVRNTGHGYGAPYGRPSHRRQVGFAEHSNGGLVVPGRHYSGECKNKLFTWFFFTIVYTLTAL